MHWKTLKKILEHSGPPGYRQSQPRRRKKLGPYEESIRQILKEDKAMPKKQRHTAKRIFERLQKEGYVGGYTAVKDAVREMEQKNQEVFVPLAVVFGSTTAAVAWWIAALAVMASSAIAMCFFMFLFFEWCSGEIRWRG